MFIHNLLEHRRIGFVMPQFGFQAGRFIDADGVAFPFEPPGFECLGTFELSLVVGTDFGFDIFGGADEPAIHPVDEDIDNFHGVGVILISIDLLVGVLLSLAVAWTGTSSLASGKYAAAVPRGMS